MNIHYIKSLIVEKSDSAKGSEVEGTVSEIIEDLKKRICEDENVSSLDDLDDSKEINPQLNEFVKALEYAI